MRDHGTIRTSEQARLLPAISLLVGLHRPELFRIVLVVDVVLVDFSLPDNSVVLRMGISFVRPPASPLGEAVHLMEMLHPLTGIEEISRLESLPWPDTSDTANFTDCARR